ncbi:unnamed protein product [Rhizophagus irregularis]|nr:unnamed protein product [Rhizophagus irregularis]CAB5350576.1 unnamed protein product [Rhizophagus irregularis]
MEGADIETAIRDIRGTSVAHLEPNRTKDQNKRAKNTLPGIDPKRLTRERLLFELKKRNINVINTAKRDGLVKELELGLANETEMIQDDISENQENQNIIW